MRITTTFFLESRFDMRKLASTIAALTSAAALTVAGIATANADTPITVHAGEGYYIFNEYNTPDFCTIGAVGTDQAGNKVALSAGHCANVGMVAADIAGNRLGVFTAARNPAAPGDYSVIKLDDNVQLTATATSISAPKPFQQACKDGVGFMNMGRKCGVVLVPSTNEASSTVFMFFGDSGGPVTSGNLLLGFTSRMFANEGPEIFTRADWVIQDLTARGGVGAGFKLAGSR